MNLTARQRDRLVSYCMWHEKAPTRADLLRRIMPGLLAYGLLIVIAATGIVFGLLIGEAVITTLSVLLLGYFAGLASATTAHVLVSIEMWPLVEEITNWDRVSELKRDHPEVRSFP
jgi:hypothetical protein